LTQAVRERDTRRTIVVASHEARPATFAQLRPTRDPHTLYAFHCFEPQAFTLQGAGEPLPAEAESGARPATAGGPRAVSTYPGEVAGERWDRARLQRLLDPVLEFRRVYEVPLYMGAFGVAAGAPRTGQLTWLRTLLSLCRGHGIGWAYWTYRGDAFGLVGALPRAPSSGSAGSAGEPPGPSSTPSARFVAPQGVDYDLLGVLQSEA
jgi:hypothetical protein